MWLIGSIFFLFNTTAYSYVFWAPTIIKEALHTSDAATGLVVAPLDTWTNYDNTSGVMLLRVTDTGITEIGTLAQPHADGYARPISRSLMIGDTLWTLSDSGLMATDPGSLHQLAWLRFG